MATLTQAKCNAIARKLNTRPREHLGFQIPEECFVGYYNWSLHFKLDTKDAYSIDINVLDSNPQGQQIIIGNFEELKPYLFC